MKVKKIIGVLLALFVVVSSCGYFSVESYARDYSDISTTIKYDFMGPGKTVTYDKGVFGTETYIGMDNSDKSVADASFNSAGDLVVTSKKNGKTTVTVTKEKKNSNNTYTKVVYKRVIYVTSAFDNASYTLSYDKIIVNYDPNGVTTSDYKVVFSTDGKDWKDSNILTRNKNNDGKIYVGYMMKGASRPANYKWLCNFPAAPKSVGKTVEKTVDIYIGDTYAMSSDLNVSALKEKKANGDAVTLSDDLTIKALKSGQASVEAQTYEDLSYDKDGNYIYLTTNYKYTVNVNDKNSVGGSAAGSGSAGSAKPKYSNEWVDGKWYNSQGVCDYAGTLTWKSNSTGWWVEDSAGWYPVSQWQKIDGKWYYFTESGYMDYSEYRDGYWLGSDGAMVDGYYGEWKKDSKGWWFEDKSGWNPVSQWVWIDGTNYYFDSDGYMQ